MELQKLIKIRRDLHRIPELAFEEKQTQEYLLKKIETFKNHNMTIKTWKTAIVVFLKGKKGEKTIAFRTDMDGLPIKETTNLEYSSLKKRNMHACGHDFHMTIALNVLEYYSKNQSNNDLIFIFQPAEEAKAGAKKLLESEILTGVKIDKIFALHVAPELPVGVVSTKSGILFANSSEVKVEIKGKSSHAAFPHLGIDTVVALGNFINQIHTITSRNISPNEMATITIGKIEAGTVMNSLAEKAMLEGTVRSLNDEVHQTLKQRLNNITKGIAESFECETKIEFPEEYKAVVNKENCVQEFEEMIKEKTTYEYKEAEVKMTAEDFGYFLEKYEGFMFWLGVDSKSGLHTSDFNPKEEALLVGYEIVKQMIWKWDN